MAKIGVSDKVAGPNLPEDVYKATVVRISERELTFEGKTRPGLEITFQIQDDPDFSGVEISGVTTLLAKLTPKSKLRQWAEAILNTKFSEGYELDTDDLIGKTCRISTWNREGSQGGTFTNIKDVLSYRTRNTQPTEKAAANY